jgi:hypothetical protein
VGAGETQRSVETKTNKSILMQKENLKQEEVLVNGAVYLKMQSDGNLVLYNDGKKALWSSGTYGRGVAPYRTIMQDDGNLVLYDAKSSPLWHSETYGRGTGPYRAILQSDRNFVLYDSKNAALWSTGTYV